jgi:hypothetical protein
MRGDWQLATGDRQMEEKGVVLATLALLAGGEIGRRDGV